MEQGDRRLKSKDINSRAAGYRSRPVITVRPRFRTSTPSPVVPPPIIAHDIIAPKSAHALPVPNPKAVQKHSLAQPKLTVNKAKPVTVRAANSYSDFKIQHNSNKVPDKFANNMPIVVGTSNHRPQKHSSGIVEPIKDYSVNKATHYKQAADADLAKFKKTQTLPLPHKSRTKRLAHKIKHTPAKQKSGYGLLALAATLFILGVAVNLNSLFITKKIEAQNVQTDGVIGDDTSGRPGSNVGFSETKPTETTMRKYVVAPDLPKYINVESLGVWSRVIRVGADANNQIGTPKNVYDTAWYEGSAKPGQPGAAFINGHVLGPTKGGIFAGLSKVKVGAKISVTMGDNKVYNYRVVATEKIDADKVDMNKVLRPYDPTKQGLNLMTCNGKYIKDQETFDKRFIVYTVREN